jgi:hypothetical protein
MSVLSGLFTTLCIQLINMANTNDYCPLHHIISTKLIIAIWIMCRLYNKLLNYKTTYLKFKFYISQITVFLPKVPKKPIVILCRHLKLFNKKVLWKQQNSFHIHCLVNSFMIYLIWQGSSTDFVINCCWIGVYNIKKWLNLTLCKCLWLVYATTWFFPKRCFSCLQCPKYRATVSN